MKVQVEALEDLLGPDDVEVDLSLGQSQEQMIVGWSQDGKRVIDAVEDWLEKCAQVIVKFDLVENLLRPENLEISQRCV